MEIGKKDVIWGYLSLILVQSINALLLPFVLIYLDPLELGLWYTFTSLYGLAMLIDFGFKSTISRHISYVWSGADDLKTEGYVTAVEAKDWNENFFIKLLSTIKALYYSMGLILLVLLSTIGTFFIYTITQEDMSLAISITSWLIYMVAIILNISFSFWSSTLKGIGAIKYYNQTLIIAKITQLFISILLLVLGYGILGVSVAYLVSVIFNRIILTFFFYNFDYKTSRLKGKIKVEFNLTLLRKLLPNTIRTGIASLANYLILNFPILLASYFLSLEVSGKFGLTSQVVALVITLANSYFNTYLSKFNFYRVRGKMIDLKKLFSKAIFINYAFVAVLFILILLLGNYLLRFIPGDNELLPINVLLIIMTYRFFYNNQGIFTALLSTKNTVPYYKSFIVSSVITVIIQIIMLSIFPNIYSLLLPILLIQLLYNNWYWPLYVLKDLKK